MDQEMIREGIKANVRDINARIVRAAQRASRDPAEVKLVAVTKTVDADRVRLAYDLGLRDFGENRVEEAEIKLPPLRERIETYESDPPLWHLIGHLQSRKSARALAHFDLIHSVDSTRLAQRLSRQAGELGRIVPILLELNVSGEEAKYGFGAAQAPDDPASAELLSCLDEIISLPNLDVRGLMTVAPLVESPEQARPFFQRLRAWRDSLAERHADHPLPELSMGMTDDFEIAVEEGATMLRLGRAIFGPRTN